ncbi:MAG: RluA family pseudouridine synthase [Planctomycetota bacterium]
MTSLIRNVTPADLGLRLDQFLARQPEVGSRSRAKDLIDHGKVQVPGQKIRAGLELQVGLDVHFDPSGLPSLDRLQGDGAVPPPVLSVLHIDEWIVVIDKPAGLVSHPPEGRSFAGHSVASAAQAQFGVMPSLAGDDRPGVVHRLDKETSGVMLLARTEAAFHALREQWQARDVDKEYRCISFGVSRFDTDWIEREIATDARHPERMTVVENGGREASTYYEVVERFAGFTHFRCLPKTGRTHQIRVHMTSIGHSLVGDRLYRSRRAQSERWPEGAPLLERHALHAVRLRIEHPGTGAPMEFTAPMPSDMQNALAWLQQHRKPK